MKKRIGFVFLCLALTGCASVSRATAGNRINLLKLSIGMSKQDAIGTMGTDTVKGWSVKDGSLYDMLITNPYRSEILSGKEKVLEVIYYVTDVKNEDAAITDDELTPLVFDNGILLGWGWSFLDENIQKYEIRVR